MAMSDFVKRVGAKKVMSEFAAFRALLRASIILLMLAIALPAHAQLLVNKSFVPANVSAGQPSSLTIVVINNTTLPANNISVTDDLPTSPAGLAISGAGLGSNSCGGTVIAVPGTKQVKLTGGSIPASSPGSVMSCTIVVEVTATTLSVPASYINTIPVANVSSSVGGTGAAATATLAVSAPQALTGSKSFAAANIHGNGAPIRMRITLNNPNGFAITGAAFTDTFPAQLQLATVPNATSTCGGTLTAVSLGTSVALSAGTIPATGSCTIDVDVVARTPTTTPFNNTATNTIAANGITSTQGATNSAALSASVTVQKAALITKTFTPASITAGATSVMTLTFSNFNATSTGSFNITDAMAAGVTVVGPVTTTCGGVASSTATSVTITGGSLAAAPAGLGATTCTLTATVTAPTSGSYVDNVTAGNLGTTAYAAATATLTVTDGASVAKTFAPATIPGGGTSTLTVTITNRGTSAISNFNLTDPMPTGVTAVGPASTTCTGGTASFTSTSLTVTGGTLAAPTGGGTTSCTMSTAVTASTSGSYTNTIPAGSISGVAFAAASATLTVNNGATIAKAFAPASIAIGGTSILTVTITNRSTAAISGFTLTDPLPAGITATGPASTTCTGGTASFTASSVTVAGGTLAAPTGGGTTSCTLTATVTGTGSGTLTNTIPAGSLSGTPYVATSANLQVSSTSVIKAFSPATNVPISGVSALTITLRNSSTTLAAPITSFIDNLTTMGTGFVVDAGASSTTCTGATLVATPGGTTISLTGGSIPVAPSVATPGTCTITVPVLVGVTATTGTKTNTIPVDALVSTSGNNLTAATATLRVIAPITGSKAFSVSPVGIGNLTRLTITINRSALAGLFTNLSITDPLPGGFKVAPIPNPATTCTGGTVTAIAGATSVSLAGGSLGSTVAAAASCTVSVDLIAPTTISAPTNTIAVGGVTATTSAGTVRNTATITQAISVVGGVTLNKSFTPVSVTPGGTSRLVVFIANNGTGASNLTGVLLADALPFGLVLKSPPAASFIATLGTCTGTINAVAGASTLGITGASIAAGSTCELSADVTTLAVGNLTNTLAPNTLTSTQGISNINTATATLVSSGPADIQVTKTDGFTQIAAGQSVTYTVEVRNNSTTASAVGVPVSDPEPVGMTFTSWSCVASSGSTCGTATGANSIATTASLAPLGTATYTILATLDPASLATSLTNQVTINPSAAGILDTISGNNTASDIDAVVQTADLAVVKTVDRTSASAGDTVTFTVAVTNNGPSDAAGVSVADPLPAGYTLVSATPSTGSYTAPTWTIGALANGSSASLTIVATMQGTGSYTNVATVTATTTDPTSTNNSATSSVSLVALTPLVATPDSVTGINGASGAANVLNVLGGDTLNAVAATTGTVLISQTAAASNPGVTLSTASGNVSVAAGTPAGTYVIGYRICEIANPTNCANSTATITVAPSADLRIVKSNGVTTVLSGSTVTYTVTVTNIGPDTITGAIVTDVVGSRVTCPAGNTVTITGSGVPAGAYTIANLTGAGIALDALASSQSAILTYSCQVN
jgi:uncharacterized repeat protein (TIGR01451 family)